MKKTSIKNLSIFSIILVLTLGFTFAITETGNDQGTILVGNSNNCQEYWNCFWTDCINNSQMYYCFDINNCGTTSLIPENNGEIRACGVFVCGNGVCETGEDSSNCPSDCGSSGGGGSGGSGGGSSSFYANTNDTEGLKTNISKSCQEKWFCEDWSNLEESCGTRKCIDLNECGTENLKPTIEIECERLGLSRLTGAVIGGVQNFFQEPKAYAPIIAILVLGIGILMIPLFKKTDKAPKNNINKQFKV